MKTFANMLCSMGFVSSAYAAALLICETNKTPTPYVTPWQFAVLACLTYIASIGWTIADELRRK
jgi:hypothetical protein